MRPARSLLFALLTVAAVAGLIGCLRPVQTVASGDVSPKLRQSSYVEEGSLVAVVVSARAASIRTNKEYWPFEVAVVNKGLKSLTLTPESFVLVAADGQRYGLATAAELREHYGNTDIDRRFAEAAGAVASRYGSYALVPSNFTPGFDDSIPRDRVSLPRFSFMLDFLYFPRPDAGNWDEPFELFVDAPELTDPVFVRFRVPTKEKKD